MIGYKTKAELLYLGLSPKHKGFYYICRMLNELEAMGADDSQEEYRRLYLRLPEGRKRAERCISYAICFAWDVNKGRIREMFPCLKQPPSPMEFILYLWMELKEDEERNEGPDDK